MFKHILPLLDNLLLIITPVFKIADFCANYQLTRYDVYTIKMIRCYVYLSCRCAWSDRSHLDCGETNQRRQHV